MEAQMDDAWIANALQGILPEQILQPLQDHVFHPSGTLRTISSHAVFAMQRIALTFKPVLSPLADRAVRALQDSPDIVFVGFLLAAFFTAFQILIFVQRTLSFFTRLIFRALFWTFIGLVLMAVWQRGPEAVATDVVVVVSKLVGYAAIVKDIWLSEYQKYDAQTRAGGNAGAYGGTGSTGKSAGYSGRGGR